VKLGDMASAEAWLHRVIAADIEADIVMRNRILSGYSKIGDVEHCTAIWEEMLKQDVCANTLSYNLQMQSHAVQCDATGAVRLLR